MGPADTLEGRTALITGAGRGIGRTSALELAGAGARVALPARSRDELNDTPNRVRDGGRTAVAALSFAVLPALLEQRWGRIVNVSSGIAQNPAGMPRANACVTSKAALEAHTLNLAAELAEQSDRALISNLTYHDTGEIWNAGSQPTQN